MFQSAAFVFRSGKCTIAIPKDDESPDQVRVFHNNKEQNKIFLKKNQHVMKFEIPFMVD